MRVILELLRVIFIFLLLGGLLGFLLEIIYLQFGYQLEGNRWMAMLGIYIVIFVQYRNKFQFSGWYKGDGRKKLPKIFSRILVGCSFVLISLPLLLPVSSNGPEAMKPLDKEGVAPYVLSTDEKFLLQSIGLEQDVLFVSFKAPQAAKSMNIVSYVLENEEWTEVGGGRILLGEDAEPNARLEGLLTMLLKEDYAIQFQLVGDGLVRSTFPTSKPLEFEHADRALSSLKASLSEFQEIELNQEIPVALMVYNEAQMMKVYDLEDYYSPAIFAGMDLVQAVTVTFSEQMD